MIDLTSWTCPLPLRDYPTIVMGHGSGGQMSFDLVHYMFLPLFNHTALARLGDSTVLESQDLQAGAQIAVSLTVLPSRRCFSQAVTSVNWPSMAPSMTWL